MPYRQSYAFNAFGNMTQRNNLHWGKDYWQGQTNNISYTYENNRVSGWTYDADGRATLSFDNQTYQSDYDARGLLIRHNTMFSVWNTVDQNIVSRYSNGDGREVKRQKTVFAEDPNSTEWPYGSWTVEVPTYYIRSSVLGGETLTEVNSTGRKVKTHVIAAGAKIAEQKQYYGTTTTQQVFFENWDAAGISRRTMTATGTAFLWDGGEESPVEADPMGGNVGTTTPYIELLPPWEPPQEFPDLLPILSDSPTYVNGQRVTCSLDGFAIGCAQAQQAMDNGSAIPAALAPFQQMPGFSFNSHGLGIFTWEYWVPGNDENIPLPPPDQVTRGHWETGMFTFPTTISISWAPQGSGRGGGSGTEDGDGSKDVSERCKKAVADTLGDEVLKEALELMKNPPTIDIEDPALYSFIW